MQNYNINERVYGLTVNLLTNYTNLDMPPTDYLNLNEDELLIEKKEDYETILVLFISINKHRHFLTDVTKYFYCLAKRRDLSDQTTLIVLSHIIITILNDSNKKDVLDILRTEQIKKMLILLKFFNRATIVEDLFSSACNYFEEEYVMQNIILNIKNNKNLLQELLLYFKKLILHKKASSQRGVTKPLTPRISLNMYSKPIPPTPTNSIKNKVSSPRPVPKSTYNKPKIAGIIAEIKENNKKASTKLLEDSNRLSGHLTSFKKSKEHSSNNDMEYVMNKTKPEPPAPKPIIVKTNLMVKKTASTILREASRLIKGEEEEIKKINNLLSGANHSKYEQFLNEVRSLEEESRLQDIEKKHLQGLLTREEAIIARQNQLEINKAKRAQYDLEQKETEEVLKQIKHQNDEKIKSIIQKTQEIQTNIEEKKKRVLNKNHRNAQDLLKTTRLMYEEALLREKTELDKKIEIIKEIKALSSIKDFHANRFDPTETMNFGLLCEMSLSELQERALINKICIDEELEKRKNSLRKQKLEHQQFLTCTEQFIEDCHQQKRQLKNISKEKKSIKTALDNKEIKDLKEKLKKIKQKRLAYERK